MTYTKIHLAESIKIIELLNSDSIENIVSTLSIVKSNSGRIFFLVGIVTGKQIGRAHV